MTKNLSDNVMEINSESKTEQKSPTPNVGCLALKINDPRGHAITDLDFQIHIRNEIVFSGKTDSKGSVEVIENLKLGSVFDIHVKTDKGDFKKVATGRIDAEQNVACLKSPKSRFEFSTYANTGKAGKAADHKSKVIEAHNQQPDATPTISGNELKKPTIKDDHDDKGLPVAAVVDGATNWYGVNNANAAPPPRNALEKLNQLITFMEHQSTLNYRALPQTEVTVLPPKNSKKPPKITKHDVTSEEIITQMRNRTFKEPASKLPTVSTQWCGRYVKIGLWYAGYGPAMETIGNGVGPARLMGPELIKAGFADANLPKIKISVGDKQISQPDITFSLPGDVIVYEETASPSASGHIDVRTYHGFVSDMYPGPARNCFPNVRKYTVIGVYRKYSDTLAGARVKAFLKIIREHEANGFDDPYHALKWDGKKHISFSDLSKHPYEESGKNEPAGAYQIKWNTFKDAKKATGWPASFTQIDQDRAAIYELQGRPASEEHPRRSALGCIMEGKIERAVNDAKLWKLFACLPGGGKQQLIDMKKLKQDFNTYTEEFSK